MLQTVVPFLNCWVWWRQARYCSGARKRLCAGIAVLLAAGSLVALIAASVFLILPQEDWVASINRAAGSGVVIVTRNHLVDGRERTGVGTGFVIAAEDGQALILTNKHVVSPGKPMGSPPEDARCVVVSRMGSQYSAQVVGWHVSPDVDLALLVADAPMLRPLAPIGRFEDVGLGEDVLAVGHPEGVYTFSVSRGTVEMKREGLYIQSSVPTERKRTTSGRISTALAMTERRPPRESRHVSMRWAMS